jgi:threonine dehydrogenase-like Zn-dependent dehydrogenase
LVDVNPARAEIAKALGLDFRLPGDASTERNLIVHASGSEAGLVQALNMAAPEGRIIEMSWFGDQPVRLPLGEAFHSRRLTLRCSQVGQISPRLRGEWDYRRRLELVLTLLRDHPELVCLVDGESDFEDLPQTMKRLVDGGGVLCHRVRYPEDA